METPLIGWPWVSARAPAGRGRQRDQRDRERRDVQPGNEPAVQEPDHDADPERGEDGEDDRPVPVDVDVGRAHRAEGDHRPRRQVDAAGDDDHADADREDAVVGQVEADDLKVGDVGEIVVDQRDDDEHQHAGGDHPEFRDIGNFSRPARRSAAAHPKAGRRLVAFVA